MGGVAVRASCARTPHRGMPGSEGVSRQSGRELPRFSGRRHAGDAQPSGPAQHRSNSEPGVRGSQIRSGGSNRPTAVDCEPEDPAGSRLLHTAIREVGTVLCAAAIGHSDGDRLPASVAGRTACTTLAAALRGSLAQDVCANGLGTFANQAVTRATASRTMRRTADVRPENRFMAEV
jgi:hypothetical protein